MYVGLVILILLDYVPIMHVCCISSKPHVYETAVSKCASVLEGRFYLHATLHFSFLIVFTSLVILSSETVLAL